MAGNEIEVVQYLLRNQKSVHLRHIGQINEVKAPSGFILTKPEDSERISTQDSRKKADVYINGKGVSIKQMGGSFAFNRLQRAELEKTLQLLEISNLNNIIKNLDTEVKKFHEGLLDSRNRKWSDFYSEDQFFILLEFLMMKGSPNEGFSRNQASLILEASKKIKSPDDIEVYNFNEYFDKYKAIFKIAIRRQWVGQKSESEHKRALGLSRKLGNAPWIFGDVKGEPSTGWRKEFPLKDRKTVYFLMIEKEKNQRI